VLIGLGLVIGRRTTATDLPQTVAALHSVVGLAAVLTSFGSVMADIGDISTLHLVAGYLGVLIGKFTISSLHVSNLSRWRYVYRVCGGLPQTRRPHDFQAHSNSWASTPLERLTPWC
jgi:hypothetical protein